MSTKLHLEAGWREPLGEYPIQQRNQLVNKRRSAPRRRAYGKAGTVSSRTIFQDFFLDENEIDSRLSKINLSPAKLPSAVSPTATIIAAESSPRSPSVLLSRKSDTKQAFESVDSPSITQLEKKPLGFLAPLVAESHKSKDVCEFSSWADRVTDSFNIVKVSEGSYGEVYKLQKKSKGGVGNVYHDSIFKLVPIRTPLDKNNNLTPLDGLVREVKILKRMDAIPGFVRFRDVTVLRGASPPAFSKAWEAYYEANKAKDPKPDHPSIYLQDQTWAMLEMGDCGEELESLGSPSVYQAFDIFWSVCVALSLGEELAEFEHRDLHISNICIKTTPTPEPTKNNKLSISTCPTQPCPSRFGHSHLRTSIIDFGLSRAQCDSVPVYDPTHSLSVLKQRGRTELENLQNSTYQRVHDHVQRAEKQARIANRSLEVRRLNKWERFLPGTNVLWLEYLAKVFLLLIHGDGREHGERGDGCSGDDDEVGSEMERKMMILLQGTLDLLVGGGGGGGCKAGERNRKGDYQDARSTAPRSAKEVIEMARERGILGEEDVVAIKESLEES